MKKITNSILLILTLISFSSFSYAQNGKISGKIFDNKNGEVLIGAKIVIEGIIIAASSDYEGKFTLANV
ncbi:MAG: hypothetical protein JHD28_09155, partial [Bacteroidia bacterium]|nr:hypothetical protein [Bacteroidia bacterium]